ncbi:UDP-4-amino-4,6-dideoxy-N-acetyl-beta-L-altrosamine transaminase [Pseudorhodoplanes sp.]|uniref:UDP-4-amino-4, 6-dideoxy-N-acetyl-beta-L-altrosamine transaminase n=1 Tax=Pseudorhodoplanes sp. TaxID=1934341 RepID=UPI002B7163B6|nr:UDP-4-amino-4,6-dideoxy-N-acetyl-beta-L-altrosamine transaminase [Pseudorhodoplanes sp.]HWV54441.1 UDP-4-amino-4,6-dideoxy-N-acetyl-beta-L-altrosamine transaminase [Pseudorhodoplanes sp.]
MTFLAYGRHRIEQDDIDAVVDVLKGDWLTTGPAVERFESEICTATSADFAVSCNSGTAALHMTAMALGLRKGDVAIVPAITFLATASAPRLTGADIVFADVDPATGLMTPETFEAAIAAAQGKAIRAAYPVHLGGQVCDMEVLHEIASARGITLVEDACHALGGRYSTRSGRAEVVGSCAHSDMSVFSFHPVKTVTCGEGGAVTTRSADLAQRLKDVRNHGLERDPAKWLNDDLGKDSMGGPNPWYYEMTEPAPNYRLSDINAALGASQLRKLGRFVQKRQLLAGLYDELLAPYSSLLKPLGRRLGVLSGWHLYVVMIDFDRISLSRAALMNKLRASGIGTQVHYIPVPWQPYWRAANDRNCFPGAAEYYRRCLSLPLSVDMNEGDVRRVVDALGKLLRE